MSALTDFAQQSANFPKVAYVVDRTIYTEVPDVILKNK